MLDFFLVNRPVRRKPDNIYLHWIFKGYIEARNGQGARRNTVDKDVERIPRAICIVCNRHGCYSSVLKRTEKEMYNRFLGRN